MKKTDAQKQLEQLQEFSDQLHNLLIKYPNIRLSGDVDGDVVASIGVMNYYKTLSVYVPTSGKQDLISK